MLVTGDVKCLHCGFLSGRWVGVSGAPVTRAGLKRLDGAVAGDPCGGPDEAVRCQRCDGPVFLDDANPVISSTRLRRIRRLREQIAAFDAHRGGRAA